MLVKDLGTSWVSICIEVVGLLENEVIFWEILKRNLGDTFSQDSSSANKVSTYHNLPEDIKCLYINGWVTIEKANQIVSILRVINQELEHRNLYFRVTKFRLGEAYCYVQETASFKDYLAILVTKLFLKKLDSSQPQPES